MRLRRIGVVRNGMTSRPDDWDQVVSKIVLDERYVEGLYRLTKFKHIWVIFGFHKVRGWVPKVHPRRDPSLPLMGVFATRSPTRPNRLGLSKVRLVSVKGNIVKVKGLDAFDGSPVFDIKPNEDEIDW